jgi:hypothetical protein
VERVREQSLTEAGISRRRCSVRRRSVSVLALGGLTAALTLVWAPAGADHTNPNTPLAPTEGAPPGSFTTHGAGTWSFIDNFPINPGTDLEFFQAGGNIYLASGTLGQAPEDHVGQRIVQLTGRRGAVNPTWRADHGSAACVIGSASVTGLQHDSQVTGYKEPELLTDTTDANGRCHDTPVGGIELIDISGIEKPSFEPREIHLIRHAGFSHTHTMDVTRPWILYNSSSDFSGRPWIDVIDLRTCLGLERQTLAQKRDACRPTVFRIPFQPDWSRQRDSVDGNLVPGSEAACHDITSQGSLLYCAGINATLIFDVSGLTNADGSVKGTPLPCEVVNASPAVGATTGAKVTNCAGPAADSPNANPPGTWTPAAGTAEGWQFLGTFNHPGRDCVPGRPAGTDPNQFPQNCNANVNVPPDEGVSISHEADPSWDGNYMFVTDERGGGVVPPGASCAPGIDNPQGNGGAHVFDIRDPSNIQYALTPGGDKAVFISDLVVPAATFCDIHVIEHIPDEQRLIVAYYSSGTKIVDYWIDANGRFIFRETASLMLPNANTWAVEDFKITKNRDGTRTYFFVASDIQRGIDVFSWTGPTNKIGTPPPADTSSLVTGDAGLIVLALVAFPAAAVFGRRRRRA